MDEPTNGARNGEAAEDTSYDFALRVVCPICQALPGQPCVPSSLTAPHCARIELARAGER